MIKPISDNNFNEDSAISESLRFFADFCLDRKKLKEKFIRLQTFVYCQIQLLENRFVTTTRMQFIQVNKFKFNKT